MRTQREVVERLRIVLRVELSNKLKNIARILLPYLADSAIAIFGRFFSARCDSRYQDSEVANSFR